MKRVWLRREEIDGIMEIFRQELKAEINQIPFKRILPILHKPEASRLIWSRTARQEFARWGIKVGLRNNTESFVVRIVDPERWRNALGETAPVEPPMLQDRCQDDDGDNAHLIPKPDPYFIMPEFGDDLRTALESGERVLLTGPTGSGKTSIVRELAAQLGRKFMRINLNGETSVSDVIGSFRVKAREMQFQYGPLPIAMRIGAWLCLDELDAALPQVLFVLQSVLEEDGKLFIPETGETIIPHPDFRIISAANTIGKGDDSGLYSGTNVLNESHLDRYQCVFHSAYLPEYAEVELLQRKFHGLGRAISERMVRVANDLRKALLDGVIYSTFSTRRLLAWTKMTVGLGDPKKAAVYAILNKLSADDRRIVAEVLQRHGF